jgi:hypothetical protein
MSCVDVNILCVQVEFRKKTPIMLHFVKIINVWSEFLFWQQILSFFTKATHKNRFSVKRLGVHIGCEDVCVKVFWIC